MKYWKLLPALWKGSLILIDCMRRCRLVRLWDPRRRLGNMKGGLFRGIEFSNSPKYVVSLGWDHGGVFSPVSLGCQSSKLGICLFWTNVYSCLNSDVGVRYELR